MRARADRDYYAILGVPESAPEDEVKRAYRRLALRHHPDRNRGDKRAEERFKEISEAYAVLMDPGRRREYDALRRARAEGARGRAPRWRQEDLFRDLFTDPRTASVFDDLTREWTRQGLRFDEAFLRDVFFRGRGVIIVGRFGIRWVGARRPRAGVERVPEGGPGTAAGETVASRPGFLGWLGGRLAETGRLLARALAPAAEGTRRGDLQYEIALTAGDLREGGRYRLTIRRPGGAEELLVRVPPGLRTGTRLRLRGKGEPRPDGTPGDLYLHVRLKP